MKKTLYTFCFCALAFGGHGQNLNFIGHQPTTSIPYNASPYTFGPKMRHTTGITTSGGNTNNTGASTFSNFSTDLFVNFTYDTSPHTVYVVYTTNGTNPNKTNGTSATCSFSTYTAPNDRLWRCTIPAQSTGTTLRYIFYISNNSLANGFGRIDGFNGNQYLTSWDENSVSPYQYSNPQPVTWGGFEGKVNEKQAVLNWNTLSEVGNSHFEVQRSVDAKNFETIGRVNGAATIQANQEYQFTDASPRIGPNYYRLKQVDFDGKFSYSRIISVIVRTNGEVALFPNPATDKLRVEGLESGSVLSVIDAHGKQLYRTENRENSGTEIDVKRWPKGSYFLKINEVWGVKSVKFVVE